MCKLKQILICVQNKYDIVMDYRGIQSLFLNVFRAHKIMVAMVFSGTKLWYHTRIVIN